MYACVDMLMPVSSVRLRSEGCIAGAGIVEVGINRIGYEIKSDQE